MSGLCGLKRAAELTRLARQLYDSWIIINDLIEIAPAWEQLAPDGRHRFVTCASDMIDVLRIDREYFEPMSLQLEDEPQPPAPALRLLRFPEEPHA